MRHLRRCTTAAVTAAATILLASATVPAQAQQGAYQAPRTPDGKPDLNGIWQAVNTAHWNLQDHSAEQGPVLALGAAFSIPAGRGVVVGNEIPYTPEGLKQKEENAANWLERDPEIKCYMPGVPRATYMPYPFQIVQTPDAILIAYEFANASRVIYMTDHQEPPVDSWMGWSNGRWEGDTLVVEATGFNDQTWFDRAGNHHSSALKVTERYTRIAPDALQYEATIEDPNVFTRPWTIRMPLYRRLEENAQVFEYKCIEFVEELMYGHLTKKD